MRVFIEEYRGWEIYFDTDREDFYTVSNEYDRDEKKRSYASAKKFIDDYIKENNVFKPIEVQKLPSMFNNGKKIKLIGIRKDRAFMCEEDGKKRQFSQYDEKDYFLVDERNDGYFKEIKRLNEESKKIDEQIKEINKSLFKVTVKELKQRFIKE